LRRSSLVLCVVLGWVVTLAGACGGSSAPQTIHNRIAQDIREGNLTAANTEVDRALLKYGSQNTEWSWRFRLQKAHILASQSDPAAALAILNSDLPAFLSSTDIAVRKDMTEGMAYRMARNFSTARERLSAAENLAVRAHAEMLCEVLNFRGALEFDEKNYVKAEDTFRQALALARQYHRKDQEASALGSLALVAIKLEHFDEAIDRSETALQVSRSLNMQALIATILGNLGWSYFQLSDFENALTFYKQAAEGSERSNLTGYRAYWFSGVANSYEALHEYAEAEELSKRTLASARTLNDTDTVVAWLDVLSEIELRMRRLDDAEHHNQEALSLDPGHPDSVLLSGRIQAAKGNFQDAEKLIRRVMEDKSAGTGLQWEAQGRIAELHESEGYSAKSENEFRKSIDMIRLAQISIPRDDLRLSYLSSGIEFYDDLVSLQIRHGRSEDALRSAEQSRAGVMQEKGSSDRAGASRTAPGIRPEQLAQRLHATLLFYWLGENHSYVWAITPTKIENFQLPPSREIDPLVKSYRLQVNGSDALQTSSADGKKLYEMLVAPARKLIPQGSRVIVLPDSSLYSLNFETLIVPDPQPHFWIEDATISTANSLTLLGAAGARPPSKEKKLLLVGDALQASPEFPALPQAPKEISLLENYFPASQRTLLVKDKATPAAYLSSNPGDYAYLHFVTHGTASRTRPLESAVILSPEGDSYKLYARDIVQHHLNAQLVTISACNGSGTRAYSGEGLVGLSWAFLRAGAHNVIGALWEVSDTATPQLMDKLYDGLSRGQDPATALRNAKLSLLHSNSPYKKPYYWAPFQLYSGS